MIIVSPLIPPTHRRGRIGHERNLHLHPLGSLESKFLHGSCCRTNGLLGGCLDGFGGGGGEVGLACLFFGANVGGATVVAVVVGVGVVATSTTALGTVYLPLNIHGIRLTLQRLTGCLTIPPQQSPLGSHARTPPSLVSPRGPRCRRGLFGGGGVLGGGFDVVSLSGVVAGRATRRGVLAATSFDEIVC